MELTRTTADDGTSLAVHLPDPERATLLCLPGGPMLDSGYLARPRRARRRTARSPGSTCAARAASGEPADPASYRCDRQVADVEAVRRHLGLDRLDPARRTPPAPTSPTRTPRPIPTGSTDCCW